MKKLYLILQINLFLLSALQLKAEEPSYSIEEGFVTFATRGYFPILEVLIKSIHTFSSRPIVAFGINDDVPFSTDQYPQLIKKRIDVDLNTYAIYYQKSNIIAKSGIKYGIYVEADDIVNNGIDEMFNWCREIKRYPLCPIHPVDSVASPELLEILGIKKSMHYVHGHVVFAPSCRYFIQEWVEACHKYKDIAAKTNFDETILNILLWKHNATEFLPLFDPYFTTWLDYIQGKRNPNFLYYMFHGAKEPSTASQILNDLIAYHQKNRIN